MYANITMGEPNNLLPASLALTLSCFAFASDGRTERGVSLAPWVSASNQVCCRSLLISATIDLLRSPRV